MNKDKKISLVFVIKGTPYTDEFSLGEPMQAIVKQVLNKTGNVGQKFENWILKDAQGNPLEYKQHLRDYEFADGATLYLNTKEGGGGAK
jgi:hypothetical protein